MAFNFGEVLTRAWQITWKFKVLWIFGILASCSSGNGYGGNSGYRFGGRNDNGYGPAGPEFQRFFDQAGQWLAANWWVIILIVLAAILLILLFIFLGTMGRIGLIRGTLQAEAGAGSLSFGTLWQESLPYFWRVFGISFLVGLAFLFLFGIILAAVVAGGIITMGVGALCLLPLLCILIPIGIVVSLILEQTFVAIVKEDLGMVDGLKRGWEVARLNPGPVLLMALILFAISFVMAIVLAIPILIIVAPAVMGLVLSQGMNMAGLLITGILFLIFLPILILVQGIFLTYYVSAWTLTFLRLTAKPEDNTPVVVEANA